MANTKTHILVVAIIPRDVNPPCLCYCPLLIKAYFSGSGAECEALPDYLSSVDLPAGQKAKAGASVSVRCKEVTATLNGYDHFVCLNTGNWDGTWPTCFGGVFFVVTGYIFACTGGHSHRSEFSRVPTKLSQLSQSQCGLVSHQIVNCPKLSQLSQSQCGFALTPSSSVVQQAASQPRILPPAKASS